MLVEPVWCYPVKSMLGERLGEAHVTARGVAGDRRFAVVDAYGTTDRTLVLIRPDGYIAAISAGGDAAVVQHSPQGLPLSCPHIGWTGGSSGLDLP